MIAGWEGGNSKNCTLFIFDAASEDAVGVCQDSGKVGDSLHRLPSMELAYFCPFAVGFILCQIEGHLLWIWPVSCTTWIQETTFWSFEKALRIGCMSYHMWKLHCCLCYWRHIFQGGSWPEVFLMHCYVQYASLWWTVIRCSSHFIHMFTQTCHRKSLFSAAGIPKF